MQNTGIRSKLFVVDAISTAPYREAEVYGVQFAKTISKRNSKEATERRQKAPHSQVKFPRVEEALRA